MPIVTVVLPTHNRARLVVEAIASVRAQTFQDWELIVVDDGSTDGTTGLVRRCAGQDSRIRHVFQRHEGLPAARNAGLRVASGEWIAFLDDDDRWKPTKLERQVEHLRRHPEAGGVFVLAHPIDAEGRPLNGVMGDGVQPCLTTLIQQEAIWLPSQTMLRRECLRRVGLFDQRLRHGSDRELWIRILQEYPIQRIDEVLVEYRVHSGNMSSRRMDVLTDRLAMFKRLQPNPSAGLTRRMLNRRVSELHVTLARKLLARRQRGQAVRHLYASVFG